MSWDIYAIEGDNYICCKSFDTKEQGLKSLEKMVKKNKNEKVKYKLVYVPDEIGIGTELYRNGQYYGTIVNETDYFFIVADMRTTVKDELFDYKYFLKSDFEIHYVKGDFDTEIIEVGMIA